MPIFSCQPLTWQGELTCSPSTRQWSGHVPQSLRSCLGQGWTAVAHRPMWEGAVLRGQISEYKTHGASFNDGEPGQHLLGHSGELSREQQLKSRMS